ncbi:MAG TPA: glycosyl hydrolase, partial [Chryseolinea sp.]|nr:glycosyl hydrolase [Chryseolinea sp.]
MRSLKLLSTTVWLVFYSWITFAQTGPIDKQATAETVNLYRSLWKLSDKHTLFGHQHATEYGHGWSGDADRSDVKSVTGSHPAVIGVDIMGFSGRPEKEIIEAKAHLKKNVIETYERGGVTTVAWHFFNPISKGAFYWVDSLSKPAVPAIIPGGPAHEQYKDILRGVGEWANDLRAKNGKLVPLIFRPFHELDGNWFWWGKSHCTREEFTALWRFTVSYLRDSLHV